MDKYALLIVLNMPFVVYGLAKAIAMFKKGTINRAGFAARALFWLAIGCGLIFARQIFAFLVANQLTDTTTLSLADVVLATGIVFCLFLIIRIYAKTDAAERRLDELHERLSILLK